MSISTMDELAAVPVGETLVVKHGPHTVEWVRSADGLSNGGLTLPLGKFVGAVTEGYLLRAGEVRPEPGEVYQIEGAARYRYVVLAVEDNEVVYTHMRGDQVYTATATAPLSGLQRWRKVPEEEHPAWAQPVYALGASLLTAKKLTEAAERAKAAAERANRMVRVFGQKVFPLTDICTDAWLREQAKDPEVRVVSLSQVTVVWDKRVLLPEPERLRAADVRPCVPDAFANDYWSYEIVRP